MWEGFVFPALDQCASRRTAKCTAKGSFEYRNLVKMTKIRNYGEDLNYRGMGRVLNVRWFVYSFDGDELPVCWTGVCTTGLLWWIQTGFVGCYGAHSLAALLAEWLAISDFDSIVTKNHVPSYMLR
jgi:hypothetical protein